ncbi:MAG: hypothetical protein M1820_006869 [Bogoriella megaspora]|nr:MAG: hypothetical protein M1820_006869 [Bogoriella megaspora]
MPSGSESPADDYFNDLSQQPADKDQEGDESQGGKNEAECATGGDGENNTDKNNKLKRIACVVCRKRKLRCDGEKPSCGTCKRLAHDCAYDEVRRKSGPKRGYVKALEARLAQVETLLKNQEPDGTNKDAPANFMAGSTLHPPNLSSVPEGGNILFGDANRNNMEAIGRLPGTSGIPNPDAFAGTLGDMSIDQQDDSFPWEMIGLGLEEPLPPPDMVNELHRIYFEKMHPVAPIVHRPRYLAALNLSPQMRPPISLRYIMWCLAAATTEKFEGMQGIFYERARKYLQNDEMRGHGEGIISVASCQAWVLCAAYEFKNMMFPRAWLSTGRASRLAQMMGLHRLDGEGLDVKQCIPPPRDWTEREERRRTFWACFASDRYASIGTGWPMTFDERDIMSNLPSNDEAFDKSKPLRSISLEQALTPTGASQLSSFSGVVVLACLFGRNLLHLHRPSSNDKDDDLNGEFWKRHRGMEQILLNTSLAMPDHLRLPSGINDPNVIFLNMNIHTSAICLHQAAIFKADRNRLPTSVSAESKVRCISAAAEIASIMRMISHMDLSAMSPFMSFCLYVAARVFVQYLKSRPKDQQVKSSLEFLLSAMQVIKRRNPLTESFLVQLDVDLEGTRIETGRGNRNPADLPNPIAHDMVQNDAVCAPIFEVRDNQTQQLQMNNEPSPPRSTQPTQQHRAGNHGIFAYTRNEPSFDNYSSFPNTSTSTNNTNFVYPMDFESPAQNNSSRYPQMNSSNGSSPNLDHPNRQKSPFLQSQGPQRSPFMQSGGTSPFMNNQSGGSRNNSLHPGSNTIDLTGSSHNQDADGMDTSPDSGPGDHPTPSTQHSQNNPSSRTSTSYSPAAQNTSQPPGQGPPHVENFGSGGPGLFGTRSEFEDFEAQLYASASNNPASNAVSMQGGAAIVGDAVGVEQSGFGGFPDWNIDTIAGAAGGYVSTGLTPGGPGSGDWTQMLEGINGWEPIVGQGDTDPLGRRVR